jgi:Neurobeachin/BDCP, DUF4704 alpha solenoid region
MSNASEHARGSNLIRLLNSLGGLDSFFGLLQKENEPVRVWAIKIIGKLLVGVS